MSESDADTAALTTMLALLSQIAASGRNDDEVSRRLREEARAALAQLAASPVEPEEVELAGAVQRMRITPEDRALLREGLRVIEAWAREPGEETGARVDAVIERMRRELGPFIMRDREAEQAADREGLRATVRDSIARRLRESRPET
jgi:hypothetical protein